MFKKLLPLLLVASFILAACGGSATATVLPPTMAATSTQTSTPAAIQTQDPYYGFGACGWKEGYVLLREAYRVDGRDCEWEKLQPTFTPTVLPTFTPTPVVPLFSFDLFDRSLDYCFRAASEPVRGYNRVLEFNYGLRVEGDTLVEYAPVERGVDEGTWPSRVVLLNATTNRQTLCGEVEARHPILYRMAPDTDLEAQWSLTMDNVNNPDYDAAHKAASVGSGNLGLFIGSEKGVDVAIRTYDENGKLISEQFYRVEGEYCSDCYQGTSLAGNQGHFAPAPQDFSFETSKRKVLTTDLVALILPKDFLGRYEITTSVEGGHMADMWLGELNPLSVLATPTAAPTATPTSAP